MKVGEFCTRHVSTIAPDADLREAARLMRNEHVGALVVVERSAGAMHPVGILTDRDIVVSVIAVQGTAPEHIRVRDIMSDKLATIRDSDGFTEAVQAMFDRGVRRLPVLAANGTLAGILTADDLLRVVALQLESVASALRRSGRVEAGTRRPLERS